MKADIFLAKSGAGKSTSRHARGETIFAQAEPADSLFYIRRGRVKLVAASPGGKPASVAILKAGDFLGESCLAGHPVRMFSAVALSDCLLVRIAKATAVSLIQGEPALSQLFLRHLVMRNDRTAKNLTERLPPCSEQRLARALLLLASFGNEAKPDSVLPKMTHETLAEIIGTTRSRVRFLMDRFRQLGFLEDKKVLAVHPSLVKVLLRD